MGGGGEIKGRYWREGFIVYWREGLQKAANKQQTIQIYKK